MKNLFKISVILSALLMTEAFALGLNQTEKNAVFSESETDAGKKSIVFAPVFKTIAVNSKMDKFTIFSYGGEAGYVSVFSDENWTFKISAGICFADSNYENKEGKRNQGKTLFGDAGFGKAFYLDKYSYFSLMGIFGTNYITLSSPDFMFSGEKYSVDYKIWENNAGIEADFRKKINSNLEFYSSAALKYGLGGITKVTTKWKARNHYSNLNEILLYDNKSGGFEMKFSAGIAYSF